jgi:hypothetical protein
MIELPNPFMSLSVESSHGVPTDREAATIAPAPAVAADPGLALAMPEPDPEGDIGELFAVAYRFGGGPRFQLDESAFMDAIDEAPLFLRVSNAR